MQPKPSSRNSYCTICKTKFDDYKEHINLEDHMFKMRESSYNEFISEMCQAYALQTGLYISFCSETSDGETMDRRETREKRKDSD